MEIKFNTGNFTMVINGDFSAEKREEALESALKYIVQRDVATKVYTTLCGVNGKKGGKVLPENFQRESLAYSEEIAKNFQVAAVTELAKQGSFTVEVVEREEASDAAGKQATKEALAFIAQGKAVAEAVAAQIKATCGHVVPLPMFAEDLAKGITALNKHILAQQRAATKSLFAAAIANVPAEQKEVTEQSIAAENPAESSIVEAMVENKTEA